RINRRYQRCSRGFCGIREARNNRTTSTRRAPEALDGRPDGRQEPVYRTRSPAARAPTHTIEALDALTAASPAGRSFPTILPGRPIQRVVESNLSLSRPIVVLERT